MKRIDDDVLLRATREYIVKKESDGIDTYLHPVGPAYMSVITYGLSIKRSISVQIDRVAWRYYSKCGQYKERESFIDGYNYAVNSLIK